MAENKGGRPQRDFDKAQFEKLCGIMATEAEICGWFHTTDKTLSAWCRRTYGKGFSDIYKELSATGKTSLRRLLWKHAERSYAVAIFLAKQHLGMRDTPTSEEERELQMAILRAKAEAGSDPNASRQVVIINDTRPVQDAAGAGTDPDLPADNP